MKYLINAFRGFCMALADSVPGVSGGTIAFILGFYDKFITSLNNIIFGNRKEKKEALLFLIKLGIGWIIGMISAVLVLTNLFESHIYAVSSVFLGFIMFSIPLIIKEEKKCLKGKYKNLTFTIIGIVIVSLITYFNPASGRSSFINVGDLSFGLAIYVFITAMIAISAMVLPGISGSTLLLIFGLYIPIMTAVRGVLHLDLSYLPVLVIFVFGVLAGVILVIRLIKIALEKYRSQMIYLVLGLMIGSFYAIVMGPMTLEVPKDPMSFSTFNIICFIIGFFLVFGLERVKKYLEKKNIKD